ncbi:MAG: UTP--glucose-1-phosphate uridylyltransferase [Holosporaceae bacterium]|jgi:UTP--glucose-1-phosphate uridylyltransferase|nr:UTP--glucose-1-phosphate uridylyltransferase [Holosporaceae bacterium]
MNFNRTIIKAKCLADIKTIRLKSPDKSINCDHVSQCAGYSPPHIVDAALIAASYQYTMSKIVLWKSFMKISKVVFPVGGLGKRFFPITRAIPKEMLGIIDKPLIHYAFEEAVAAGIEEFIFVTRHGKDSIEDYFDYMFSHSEYFDIKIGSVCYVRQNEPRGLGHAVLCAKNLIGNESFAVMSADDFIFHSESCLGEMIKFYDGSNMVASMNVAPNDVDKYGILDVDYETDRLVVAKSVDEKPSMETAKSTNAIVGRYLLSHEIFEVLEELKPGIGGEIQLTDALLGMIPSHGLTGFKFEGKRFDCGSKEGLLSAILHVADQNEKLHHIIADFYGSKK